jgi:hypothetical protein
MTNQVLVFNSTEKTVTLNKGFEGQRLGFDNVPTVRVESGYYEVMQRQEGGVTVPVLRVPIMNTNMLIEK